MKRELEIAIDKAMQSVDPVMFLEGVAEIWETKAIAECKPDSEEQANLAYLIKRIRCAARDYAMLQSSVREMVEKPY